MSKKALEQHILDLLITQERVARKFAVKIAASLDICRFCRKPGTVPFLYHYGEEHACEECFEKEYR